MKPDTPTNFIHDIIDADNASGKHDGSVVTRFPPEPNGYLHIGHAKSICLNFGTAIKYGGLCHLRFDDTNPAKEEQEFVDSIREDVRWLGFDWGDHEYYASDYFPRLYDCAVELIRRGKAYVCDINSEDWARYRGVPTRPGNESPHRHRPVAENLDLFARMRAGEFPDGSRVLRAKIDMASPNLHLRDPALYRIRRAHHHRTGDAWCLYPMYDFAHCLSDSFENITHSLCTLEFEVHRPLYDWILEQLDVYRPQQIEFARLNLSHTVMSKRKLATLVERGIADAWDDPRLPTLSGLRRRGYSPAAIRNFCAAIGIAKRENLIQLALLEHHLRADLEQNAPRALAVLDPVPLVIENYPAEQVEWFDVPNHPARPEMGTRKVPFSRELFLEREDFAEIPPKGFFRLSPGREVRLRYAYYITCTGIDKNPDGSIARIRCTYDPATKGGDSPDGRKVKGTLHWVSAPHSLEAPVRILNTLFTREVPDDVPEGADWLESLNPHSLETLTARVETSLKDAAPGTTFQFERKGYFCPDSRLSSPGHPVFNRTVPLKDSWTRGA